jgi:hypothetical protein
MPAWSMHQTSAPNSATEYFDQIRNLIANEICHKTDNEILNVSADTYAEYLATDNTLHPAQLLEEQTALSDREEDIPANIFPPEFSIMASSVKRPIISFHLRFQPGDRYFFALLSPGTTARPQLSQNEIILEYIDFYHNPEKVKGLFNNDLAALRQALNHLSHHFSLFNAGLLAFSLREINARKEKALRRTSYLAAFNIPLKENEGAPKTFSIPEPKLREKIAIKKPAFSNEPFLPEPALDYSTYQKILKYIDDMSRNFERMPAVSADKDEEGLRDHILFGLDPHFEMGSAAGETFNKSGKTDILLRYDSAVPFIGECKFWKGIQVFHETIDQLLRYLTWRDSKSAIVLFVRNKEFIGVIQTIKENIASHPQYLRKGAEKVENWLEYIFCLPGDPNGKFT